METLRRIDEDIQALGAEAKKKYPEVSGAADRAAETLKGMREQYVSEVMRKAGGSAGSAPAKFRSAMLTAPYILACNHANASIRIVMMALNGIQLLLDNDAFELDDAQNVFRVLAIQCGVGKSETQLKILQLILQILGNIIKDETGTETILNEALIGNILTIVLSLGDIKNHASVVNTVYISIRQIMSLLFGKLQQDVRSHLADVLKLPLESVSLMPAPSGSHVILGKYESSLKTSLELLLKEFTFYLKGDVGHWLRGIAPIPIVCALDIVYDIINDWQSILTAMPAFATILKDHICVTIRNLLKNMQEDYVVALKFHLSNSGTSPTVPNTANLYATKLIKIVRCIMLKYTITPDLVGEIETMITLLLHTLHPDKTKIVESTQAPSGSAGKTLANSFIGFLTGGSNMEEQQARESSGTAKENSTMGAIMTKVAAAPIDAAPMTVPGTMSLSSSANTSNSSSKDSRVGKESNSQQYHSCGSIYLLLSNKSGNANNPTNVASGAGGALPSELPSSTDHIPAHPAAVCLEALLAFYLRDQIVEDMILHDPNIGAMVSLSLAEDEEGAMGNKAVGVGGSSSNGVSTITVCISTSLLSICTLLTSALAIGTNAAEFETFVANCSITASVDRVLSGAASSRDEVEAVVQQIHDHLASMHTVGSMYVLSLCFSILRLLTRSMSKCALQTSGVDVSAEGGAMKADNGASSTPLSTPVTTNSKHAQFNQGLLPFKKCGTAYSVFISPSFCGIGTDSGVAGGENTAGRELQIAVVLKTCLLAISELCNEAIFETCHALISGMLETPALKPSGRTSVSTIQTVGVLSEWGLIFGLTGCQRYCENILSALCKYSLPHPSGGDTVGELNAVLRQKHIHCFLQLNKIIHVVAESISDWDTIIDCFEQLMSYVVTNSTANKNIGATAAASGGAVANSSSGSSSTNSSSGAGGSNNSAHGAVSAVGFIFCAADVGVNDVVQMLGVVERFKQYACFLSDDTLVHLMTSLVSLSINSISSSVPAASASSGSSTAYAESSSASFSAPTTSSSGSASASSAPSRRMSALTSAMNSVGGQNGSSSGAASGGANNAAANGSANSSGAGATSHRVIDISSILATCLKNGTLTTPVYMSNGFHSGIIKFSFYVAVEVAKMNAYRISCVWQMLTTHLKMLASTKAGLLRSAAVHATLDVILTTLNVTSSCPGDEKDSSDKVVALSVVEQNAVITSTLGIDRCKFLSDASNGSWKSLPSCQDGASVSLRSSSSYTVFNRIRVLPDCIYFADIFPSSDTIFVPRAQHRKLLLHRQLLPVNEGPSGFGRSSAAARQGSASIQLTQTDILASLKMLSQIVHNDVRNEVIQGIYQLLQSYDSNNYDSASSAYALPSSTSASGRDSGANRLSYSGWLAILEIITNIPLSWTTGGTAVGDGGGFGDSDSAVSTPVSSPQKPRALARQPSGDGVDESGPPRSMNDLSYSTIATPVVEGRSYPSPPASPMPEIDRHSSISPPPAPVPQWSSIALTTAFNCMKLVCDELLEDLSIEITVRVIPCLASFSVQTHDVNISLTSIELMWKVTDSMVSKYTVLANSHPGTGKPSGQGGNSTASGANDSSSVYHAEIILNVMMSELFQLCTDSRPEIRNCAIKTLFSAMLSYMTHPILSNKWQSIFNDSLFPLFTQIHKGTMAAMHNKAEAFAPEVKKGVKITVHHSRNTSLKQWSETYVIALKALGRIMKSCVKSLLAEAWFEKVWQNSIEVCMNAVYVTVAAASDKHVEMFALDSEVTVASVDVLFVLLRSTAGFCASSSRVDKATASKGAAALPSMTTQEAASAKLMNILWRATWRHMKTAALGLIRSRSLYNSGTGSTQKDSRGGTAMETISKFITGLYEFYLDYHVTKFRDIDGTDGDDSASACENTANFRDLLQMLVFLTRQLIHVSEATVGSDSNGESGDGLSVLGDEFTTSSTVTAPSVPAAPTPAALQYYRVILQLLMSIHPTSNLQLKMLFCALSDLCYGRNYACYSTNSVVFAAGLSVDDHSIPPPSVISTYYFGAVEQKLRVDIGNYILSVLNILITNSAIGGLPLESPTNANLRKAASNTGGVTETGNSKTGEPNKPFLFFSQSVSATAATSMKSSALACVIKLLDAEKLLNKDNKGSQTNSDSLMLQCCSIVCNRFVFNICDVAVSVRKELVLTRVSASASASRNVSCGPLIVPAHKGISASFVPVSPPAITISGIDRSSPSTSRQLTPTSPSPVASFGTLISSIGKLILPEVESGPESLPMPSLSGGVSDLLATGDADLDTALIFTASVPGDQVAWRRFLVGMQTAPPQTTDSDGALEWGGFPITELELHIVGRCIEMKLNGFEAAVMAGAGADSAASRFYRTSSDGSIAQEDRCDSTEGSPRSRSVDTPSKDSFRMKTPVELDTGSGAQSMQNIFFIIYCLLAPWTTVELACLGSNTVPPRVNPKPHAADGESVLSVQNEQVASALRKGQTASCAAPNAVTVATISQLAEAISLTTVRIASQMRDCAPRARNPPTPRAGNMSPEPSRPHVRGALQDPLYKELTMLMDILLASGLMITHSLQLACVGEVAVSPDADAEAETDPNPSVLCNHGYMDSILSCLCDMLTSTRDGQSLPGSLKRNALFSLLTLTNELGHSTICPPESRGDPASRSRNGPSGSILQAL